MQVQAGLRRNPIGHRPVLISIGRIRQIASEGDKVFDICGRLADGKSAAQPNEIVDLEDSLPNNLAATLLAGRPNASGGFDEEWRAVSVEIHESLTKPTRICRNANTADACPVPKVVTIEEAHQIRAWPSHAARLQDSAVSRQLHVTDLTMFVIGRAI